LVQLADSVTDWPTMPAWLTGVTVHTGGSGGGAVHVTTTGTSALLPYALVPLTVYVLTTAAACVSVHAPVVDVQPVQVYETALGEQVAVIVIDVPVSGVALGDTVAVHTGGTAACHVTPVFAARLAPAALVATTL
jgi:hypothetical protein